MRARKIGLEKGLIGRTIIPDTGNCHRYECHRAVIHAGTKYRAQTIYPQQASRWWMGIVCLVQQRQVELMVDTLPQRQQPSEQ